MNVWSLLQHGLLWGLIFSLVFCAATLLIGRINVAMLVNEYPPDIRARFGPMSPATRKQAQQISLPLLLALGGVIVWALADLRRQTGELTFSDTLLATTALFQTWNLLDLLLLDWFLLLTLRPRFMILPGTEGLAGYRDYGFHGRKFLKGIPLTLFLSLVVTLLALAAEWLLP